MSKIQDASQKMYTSKVAEGDRSPRAGNRGEGDRRTSWDREARDNNGHQVFWAGQVLGRGDSGGPTPAGVGGGAPG